MAVSRKRWKLQFSLWTLLFLMFLVALILAVTPSVQAYLAIRRLSNDDLYQNTSTFGLLVHLDGESAAYLRSKGTQSNRWLLSALSDKDKFAAAHLILYGINNDLFTEARLYWDDDMNPVNGGDLDEKLIPDLVNFWSKALAQPQGFTEADNQYAFLIGEPAHYQIGDLVPCSKELAEFILEIDVEHSELDEFRHSQFFCYHQGSDTNPQQQPGGKIQFIRDKKVENNIVNGRLQYTKFHSESVTVVINWSITCNGQTERFIGKIEAMVDDLGVERAGWQNDLHWSFTPIENGE